jgi:uncharacterized protein YjiK
VYRIHRLLSDEASNASPWPLDLHGLDDLSDVYFDPSTSWLWLLSHESQAAVAFDLQGARAAELSLKKGHHGLLEDVEQAEGIVRDRHGSLLICSEPNLIYRFRPVVATSSHGVSNSLHTLLAPTCLLVWDIWDL